MARRSGYRWLRFDQGVDHQDVSPRLLRALNRLARDLGQPITITSGFRTRAEQERLYKRYVDSGYNIQYIAAKPGQSNHEKGLAVDATVNGVALANAVPLRTLQKYGITNPVKGDPVHTELSSPGNPMTQPQGAPATGDTTAQDTTTSATALDFSTVENPGYPGAPNVVEPPQPALPGAGPPPFSSPRRVYDTWQQIAAQSFSSPESLLFAQRSGSTVSQGGYAS